MDSESSPTKKGSKNSRRGKSTTTSRRGRGRGKRAVKLILSDDEESDHEEEPSSPVIKIVDVENEKPLILTAPEITIKHPEFDLETDISQLQAPTFTTLTRGQPEPMLRLDWSLPVNLIGEKVSNPMIHCCDKCLKPILIYGRLIPCKHVYCLSCGRQEELKPCPRCREKVVRVEQTGLGNVFMCSHGGLRYGHDGCRRTYLSQRDLQAHINHRHLRLPPGQPQQQQQQQSQHHHNHHHSNTDRGDREPQKIHTVSLSSSRGNSNMIPVLHSRSNLVSVPIQDSSQHASYGYVPPPSSASYSSSNYSSYASQSAAPSFSATQGYFSNHPQQHSAGSHLAPPPPTSSLPSQYDGGSQSYQWSGTNNQTYYR